jgi:hypothetical protein
MRCDYDEHDDVPACEGCEGWLSPPRHLEP